MKILPYKLESTKTKLTSQAGLLPLIELMRHLKLTEQIDHYFDSPKSNRAYAPSNYIELLILMQHAGYHTLDSIRHLQGDKALQEIVQFKALPTPQALGSWLKRHGKRSQSFTALSNVNRYLLQSSLNNVKGVTLDIDAFGIESKNTSAKWTYKGHQGYMPMAGHIAETGGLVHVDFREGNVSPKANNLEFIHQCASALPNNVFIKHLRIDCAGYQEAIFKYCDTRHIQYAIRAMMSQDIRDTIAQAADDKWEPLVHKNGKLSTTQSHLRTVHCIGSYEKAFTLIIQRKLKTGQGELDVGQSKNASNDEVTIGNYVYRAIATNKDHLSNSAIVHWYNARGEDSENRIKELKRDMGGQELPCGSFEANALYMTICTLSYNVLVLMKQLLPEDLASHRASTLRWKVYLKPAKVVKTGRQILVKVDEMHRQLLSSITSLFLNFHPPPISW